MNEIIVDTAEPPKIQNAMKKLSESVVVEKCDIGDIVCGEVCVERKSMSDFISSIMAGHIQKQLLQMQQFKHPYLIISNSFKDWQGSQRFTSGYKNKGFGVEQYIGSLASCAVRYGVTILMVDNDTQLCKLAMKLITKHHDGKEVTIKDTELLKNSITTEDLKLKILTCFEGVGLIKAQKMLKKDFDLDDFLDSFIKRIQSK